MDRSRMLRITFLGLLVDFGIIIAMMISLNESPAFRAEIGVPVMFASWIAFFLLGAMLICLTVKEKVKNPLRRFLLLTGGSAVGFPLCVVLHNLVYALFIVLFGEGFWGPGGDEPFFFLIAIIICPIAFLVGVVGSIATLRREK